jgi:hypothetical protein
LRNTRDNQRARCGEFLAQYYVPALAAAGAGPVGLLSPVVGAEAPYVLMVAQHASLDQFQQRHEAIWAKPEFAAAAAKMAAAGRPFERMEVALLRAFGGFPKIANAGDATKPARVFELRTYESDTPLSLKNKIAMFEAGEIELFVKHGLQPIFFGGQVAGGRMPNLTYMVAFDNLAAREANWRAFGTSPEWRQMASRPGWSDGEVVSNITNTLLSPVTGSQIR